MASHTRFRDSDDSDNPEHDADDGARQGQDDAREGPVLLAPSEVGGGPRNTSQAVETKNAPQTAPNRGTHAACTHWRPGKPTRRSPSPTRCGGARG